VHDWLTGGIAATTLAILWMGRVPPIVVVLGAGILAWIATR